MTQSGELEVTVHCNQVGSTISKKRLNKLILLSNHRTFSKSLQGFRRDTCSWFAVGLSMKTWAKDSLHLGIRRLPESCA